MTHDLVPALAAFALVSSITPGPNNLMLMASGANFGLRATLPHMLGVGLGFGVMILLVGVGLQRAFLAWPVAHLLLKTVSVAFLLYLAWKIATAAPPDGAQAQGRPITFWQAAAFQWINPKAWAMALTATSVYAPSQSIGAIALVALVFSTINLPSISLWTVMGRQLRRVLRDPARLRIFNRVMAALLLASLWPVVAP